MRRTLVLAALGVIIAAAGCSYSITGTAKPNPNVPATTTSVAPNYTVQETVFLDLIHREGIGSGDDTRELRRAHGVCDLFTNGTSRQGVIDALLANDFTLSQAATYAGAAVGRSARKMAPSFNTDHEEHVAPAGRTRSFWTSWTG